MKRPLAPPPLPAIETRLAWPGTLVCIIGGSASSFAARVAAQLRAEGAEVKTLRVELRRAAGATLEGETDAVLRANPDALVPALERARLAESIITVGAGLAFAAAVEPDVLVWIRAGESLLSLGARERTIVAGAHLVLEEPRDESARALASALLSARS